MSSIAKKPAPRYHVDGRVAIGLDALDNAQRKAVGEVIRDRDHFLAYTADHRKVETISKSGFVFSLSVPVGLSIIYRNSGENIEILDLMGTETLRKYGAIKRDSRTRSLTTTRKPKQSV